MTPHQQRIIEKNFHIGKLKLLEIYPLFPYLLDIPKLTCVEIGANKGLWMEGFFDIFGEQVSEYHAFEPVPSAFGELSARVSSSLSGYSNIISLHQSCVGDNNSDIEIHYRSQNTTLASILLKETVVGTNIIPNDKSVVVPQTTFDEIVENNNLAHIDIVKIDVEGYEWNILQKMHKSIEKNIVPMIYFEFGMHQKQLGQNYHMFYDYFVTRGYMLYKQQVGRNFFALVKANRDDAELAAMGSMWMLLATKIGPSPNYNGPRVSG